VVELVEPEGSHAQPPDGFLTTEGELAWLDVAENAVAASARDGLALATLANLIGSLRACWSSGAVPPSAHLAEARRLLELFGMAGPKSRLLVPPERPEPNPFARNGRRSREPAA
jgi:hypothetical protein